MENKKDMISQLLIEKIGMAPYDYVLYDGNSVYWIVLEIDDKTGQKTFFYNSEKINIKKEEIVDYVKNSNNYKWGEYKNFFVIKLRDESRYIEVLDTEDVSKIETIYITYKSDPTELCKYFARTGYLDVFKLIEHYKSAGCNFASEEIDCVVKTLLKIGAIQEIGDDKNKYQVKENYELILHFIEKILSKNKEL